MLCDVTKVHTGWGMMPKVSHCTHDKDWGKPGGSRRVFSAKSFLFKGGEAALDTVIERRENSYWKIEISDFKRWTIGFKKFVGEWTTTPNSDGTTKVVYKYTMYSNNWLAYPFHWLLTKTAWRMYMKHVLHNIHQLALNKEPYVHE